MRSQLRFKNEQFLVGLKTIPQDSGIGQPQGCPQGRRARRPQSQLKGLSRGAHGYAAQAVPQGEVGDRGKGPFPDGN